MIRVFYRNIVNLLLFKFRRGIRIGSNVAISNSVLEGLNKLNDNTVFVNSSLGRGSYIGPDSYFNGAQIGRYCSIGSSVKIVNSAHPSKVFVSTHPAFFSLSKQAGFTYVQKQGFDEFKLLDKENNISVVIGNDVWIGDDVVIMGGVRIHDGAIVGAGAIVTKNIDPYTIVAGVPAKAIKKRFSQEEIDFLLGFKWWLKEEAWILKNNTLFNDITQFMNATNK